MIDFFIYPILVFALAYLFSLSTLAQKAVGSILIFFGLGFRQGGQCDNDGYFNLVERISQLSVGEIVSSREPVFSIIASFILLIGNDELIIQLVFVVVFTMLVYLLSESLRFTGNAFLFFIYIGPVFFAVYMMSGYRQGLSMVLFWIGYAYFFQNKLKASLVPLIGAPMAHISGFAALGLCGWKMYKGSHLWAYFLGVGLVAGGIWYFEVLDRVFYFYLNSSSDAAVAKGFAVRFIYFVVPVLIAFNIPEVRSRFGVSEYWTLLGLVAVLFLGLLTSVSADRILMFFCLPLFLHFVLPVKNYYFFVKRFSVKNLIIFFSLVYLLIWINFSENFKECYAGLRLFGL